MNHQKRPSVWTAWPLYRRGIRLLSQALPHFFAAMIAHTVVTAATPYATVYLLARLVSELVGARDVHALWLWAGLLIGTQALTALLGGVFRRIKEAKWENVYRAADRIVLDALLGMEHAVLCEPATRDRLAQVRENTGALGRGLVQIPDVVQSLLYGLFGAVSAVAVTWRLFALSAGGVLNVGILAAALTAIIGLTLWLQWAARREERAHTVEVVALDRLYYAVYDTVSDTKKAADMRLYQQGRLMLSKLQQAEQASFEKDGLKRLPLYGGGIYRALSAVLSAVWLLCVLVFTVKSGSGLSGAVCLVGALTRLYEDVARLCFGTEQLKENAPYLQTLFAFLDTPRRMYQGSLTTEKRADRDYEVEFRHVSFAYPGQSTKALSDVSVTIRAGSRVAIVGENGSGKSTFVKLLCRLYEPDEGEILLNGIDICKYDYADYIALIAAVFQDVRLFSSSTLGENVAGTQHYDAARVTQCLQDAGFGERLYEWNSGLQTPLSTVMLSPADASRMAVARALYKDAPLLTLDEPTASLDPVSEAALYAGLDRIVGDRTALFVSHRLASCRFCDEILVFDGGRIVQRGTHEELVAQTASKYHALWQAQAQYYTR